MLRWYVMKPLTYLYWSRRWVYPLTHMHTHTNMHMHVHTQMHTRKVSDWISRDQSVFLKIIDLFDGKAATIETTLVQFCDSKEINLYNVMAFGSDGAAVMTRRRTGVSAQINEHNPLMINIHCDTHRLALAAAQASDDIPTWWNSRSLPIIFTSLTTIASFEWLDSQEIHGVWEIQHWYLSKQRMWDGSNAVLQYRHYMYVTHFHNL